MEMSLRAVQQATGATIAGEGQYEATIGEARVRGWSIDSRTVNAGDLFFAIRGERFDGHAYTQVAFERGAIAAVVSEPASAARGLLLQVSDTVRALQDVAREARRRWNRPLLAVTGSAGKTSTKEILAALLGVRFRVGKTAGNLNNHLGLPLTLLRLPDDAGIAVVEMGMNHAGEIRELAALAKPQVGLVTNVGYAHAEAFASIAGIAAAKRELIESLPPGGVAILNADDERVLRFREAHAGRTITYGFASGADIHAGQLEMGAGGSAFTVSGVRFTTKLTGRHAVSNILAGLAAAHAFDISFEDLVHPVANLTPGKMRGERHEWRGVTVLDDSYNSNPEAARSMIDVLVAEPARRRIAVLGEMLELGHMGAELHRTLGSYVAHSGADVLIGIGGESRLMAEQAVASGLDAAAVFYYDSPEEAGEFLRSFVREGDAVLFKGSRGTHVEKALAGMEG